MRNKIIGIMACDRKGCIAANGALPWHLPDDLEFFRQKVKNQAIVMGRKTYESLPQHVIDNSSQVFVLSHFKQNFKDNHIKFIHTIEEINSIKELYMIGGAEIAHAFLNRKLIDEFLLTIVDGNYSGDTYLNLSKLDKYPYTVINKNEKYIRLKYIMH